MGGLVGRLTAGVIWALLGVLSVLVVSGRRAAMAVILGATAVGLATAIVDRPTALSAVLARGSAAVALAPTSLMSAQSTCAPAPAKPDEIDDGAVSLVDVEKRHIERILRQQSGRVEDAAHLGEQPGGLPLDGVQVELGHVRSPSA